MSFNNYPIQRVWLSEHQKVQPRVLKQNAKTNQFIVVESSGNYRPLCQSSRLPFKVLHDSWLCFLFFRKSPTEERKTECDGRQINEGLKTQQHLVQIMLYRDGSNCAIICELTQMQIPMGSSGSYIMIKKSSQSKDTQNKPPRLQRGKTSPSV